MRHFPSFRSVSVSWFAAAALVGWAGCGFRSEAPGGSIDAALDVPSVDASIDTPPGVTCYGPAGWQACFNSTPSGNVTLPGMINTDTPTKAPCVTAPPMGWGSPQPVACFVVGDTITVPVAGTNVNGSKPLVLVANRLITVTGLLDVAGHRGEVVPAPTECQPFSKNPDPPGAANVGGGGGAGGSFGTRAGNGGTGDGSSQNGQSALADTMTPTYLRGGCPGQAGGAAAAGDAGTVGRGGGIVYLISGGDIVLTGTINASGAGGRGGDKRAGGSGGGSGGMIVLYGATITVTPAPAPALAPILMANGGGGGGGSTGAKASDGSDPNVLLPLASAPGGNVNNGGSGGKGYPVATDNELDGTGGPSGGAGGGGGGGAAGYIRSNKPLTGALVSPAADVVP